MCDTWGQPKLPATGWSKYSRRQGLGIGTTLDRTHVYNTRTAWALARAGKTIGDDSYLESAYRHLDWACDVYADGDNGVWPPLIPHHRGSLGRSCEAHAPGTCHSSTHRRPSTRSPTPSRAFWRLLGSFRTRVLNEPRSNGASTLADHLATGRLAGFYGADWKAANRSQCVTGVAQMAVVWLTLSRHDCFFATAANAALANLCDLQTSSDRRDVHGAFAGSSPAWGLYLPFRYPNWAAKLPPTHS